MENPTLPDDVRAALPAVAQAYLSFLEAQVVQVVALQGQVLALEAATAALGAQVADLQARLRQYSGNSSRPPSSDPPDAPPRPTPAPSGRRPGGQPGHPGHRRALLPSSQVADIVVHRAETCEHCGAVLPPEAPAVGEPRREQVWDVPPVKPVVIEHQYPTVCCPTCRRLVAPPPPAAEVSSAFGPTVTALVGLLHGRFRLSARETVAVLADCFGVPLGLGSVPALYTEVGDALAGPYAEVQAAVQTGTRANVDETGWKQAGRRRWLWTAVGALGTLFLVASSRSAQTLTTLLGAFGGIVSSDRFSAYRGLPLDRRQICWAHLKRDLAAFATWGGQTGPWGTAALGVVAKIFATWHQFRAGELDRAGLQTAMAPIQTQMRALLERGSDLSPPRALCRDMLALWPALWTFLTVEGVEPTNNAAERALRPAVLWRKGCFGAASDAGNLFVERILTVTATCRQHERPLLTFLTDAVRAHRAGFLAPSLIATP
ncbi:MAG: IS66 family transposase [Deltaproteobacteria bacterium]|nr:IS66 family transposase [Deltaproteobacteria bacterium]